MKKIFILLGLLGILLAPIAQACEYEFEYCNQYIPIYRPVISGINAPANVINTWSFLPLTDDNYTDAMDGDYYFTEAYVTGHVSYFCSPVTLNRQEVGDIHLPMTIYVSLLGSNDNAVVSAISHICQVGISPTGISWHDSLDGYRLRYVSLQYRIFPSLEWNTAGHVVLNSDNGSLSGIDAPIVDQLSFNSIINASLPDRNNFTVTPEKSLPIFGAYTIDADVPAGTMIQLRLLSYYKYYRVYVYPPVSEEHYRSIVPSPSTYYAEPLSTLQNNDGDYITVTTSGKRRPRHDQ